MLSSFSLTLTPVHRNLVFLFDKLKVCSCMGQPMDLKQRKVVASWFHKKIHEHWNIYIYYIDESVLLGTKPLVDSIRHFIRDPSIFRMSPLWVSYRSMTSGLSLTLYLNSLVYHRNIFGSSSEVFGNLRKFSGNVRERSSGIRNNFGKSSEIFGRWSEIFGKSSKTPSSACLYNKKNITRRLEDMNLIFSWQKQYFTHSLCSFVKYCFATQNKIHIFAPPCNILYICVGGAAAS